ncbi:MAG: prolyl oligopeptidase family serine peptidase [Planctomycetaceae bacterium]|jgi:predicted alpha/beta superfamily hydrolase|nr:prolyl oligopeptidase family serine peptidase [Planctomycetaceae bacterium]
MRFRLFRFLLLVLAGLVSACPAFAQPDLSQKIGPTIADTGSEFYRFERFAMDSDDGGRHYKIAVGIPKADVPEKGFPVLYMLDGNAALAALDDKLFSRLSGTLPVIVTIGYDTELRFDVVSRAFDYTPAMPDGTQPKDERGRKGGGADVFAALIETKIKPKAESLVRIDKNRQAIWGHSYGGLFVLNTLFRHSEMFQNYIAVSPSLWQQRGAIFQYEKDFAAKEPKRDFRLLLFHGTDEKKAERTGDADNPVRQKMQDMRRSVPADAGRELSLRLRTVLRESEYAELKGLTHGQTFGASLETALRFIQNGGVTPSP